MRLQRGYIYKLHGSWHVRYRNSAGKQTSRKLAPFSDEYRTRKSVLHLAEDILRPINQGLESSSGSLGDFVEKVYLPHVQLHKRPSTYRGYKNLYNLRIKPHVQSTRLTSFRTLDGQRLLDKIAQDDSLSRLTLIHCKSFISGVLTYARRIGAIEQPSLMRGTEISSGKESEPTYAYSKSDLDKMLKVLTGVSKTAVLTAAYTGLSLGELQGLKWTDIQHDLPGGALLTVQRTIWHGIEGQPKTKARKDSVPLLKIVQDELAEHQKRNPGTVWIFEGPSKRPLDMAHLASKTIKTALKDIKPGWRGWHALRRGFATRLHEAGVQDRIIQSLMRHSTLAVTMKHYVKAMPEANIQAIQTLNPQKEA